MPWNCSMFNENYLLIPARNSINDAFLGKAIWQLLLCYSVRAPPGLWDSMT